MHGANKQSPKVPAEFGVGSLVSILLDGLERTAEVVRVLERDSALDGRTREALREHVAGLAKLVVDAEVFRQSLQVRLSSLAAGSARAHWATVNRRVRDEGERNREVDVKWLSTGTPVPDEGGTES